MLGFWNRGVVPYEGVEDGGRVGRELWKGVLRVEAKAGDFEADEVEGGRKRLAGRGVCHAIRPRPVLPSASNTLSFVDILHLVPVTTTCMGEEQWLRTMEWARHKGIEGILNPGAEEIAVIVDIRRAS